MVAHQVVVLFRISRIPGSILAWVTVWSSGTCYHHVHECFLLDFLLPPKNMVDGLRNTKLPVGVCMCVLQCTGVPSKGSSGLWPVIRLWIHHHTEVIPEDRWMNGPNYIVGTHEISTSPGPKPQFMCYTNAQFHQMSICERIHSFSSWDSFSMSHVLQGSFSATTNSKLVLFILLAWNNLWSIIILEIWLLTTSHLEVKI